MGHEAKAKMLAQIAKTKAKSPKPKLGNKKLKKKEKKEGKKRYPRSHLRKVQWIRLAGKTLPRVALGGLNQLVCQPWNFVEGDNFYDPCRFSSRLRLTHHRPSVLVTHTTHQPSPTIHHHLHFWEASGEGKACRVPVQIILYNLLYQTSVVAKRRVQHLPHHMGWVAMQGEQLR